MNDNNRRYFTPEQKVAILPRKIAKVYDTGLHCLKPAHRETRNGSLPRLIAGVIAGLDKRNDIVKKLLVGCLLVLRPEGIEVGIRSARPSGTKAILPLKRLRIILALMRGKPGLRLLQLQSGTL